MINRLLLALMIVLAHNVHAQHAHNAHWELAKEKNGIKVFTRKADGARFKSIKVEANLTGTMDRLIQILMDAGSNKEWVYATNNSYIIKRISPTEVLSYTETSVPWPAANRDVPLHLWFYHDPKQNTLKLILKGEPKAIPEKKGIVRIPYFDSWWDVKYDGKNHLRIVYFLETDPGGAVPAWLVNLFIAKGPYETFDALSRMLTRKS